MPGNEFGERIHNFFGQEGLSQDQHQSHVDRSWSGFSNGLVGNLRQIDQQSLIANLKSYSTQQSVDSERAQSSNSQHGLNFIQQQPIRSEYSGNLLQEHQQFSNGYMHGNLGLQPMPNEANVLGVDAGSSKDKLVTNYDFFGGQQQLNSQLSGMHQPFPSQQMTLSDMQLLKQNAVNGSRSSYNQSHSLVNDIALQGASSNCWQPDHMTGNANWVHQGSSSGFMITPEHGHANFLAQQFEPSLYGMPLGGANAPQNAFSSVQMNKLGAQHGSSLTNQPTSFVKKGDVQDIHMLPRSSFLEKVVFSNTSVTGSNSRPNFECSQQDDSHERNMSVQENFGQMEGSCPPEKSYMKVPESIIALQKSTALDPTEEAILFGSDDNLWEAFGSSLTGNLMASSSDLFDACPSLQSGSWSALMQSAVAETSSHDAGVHEWGGKQQSVWTNNNTSPHANSSNTLSERVNSDFTQTAVHGLVEKPVAQRSQMAGDIFHSSGSGIDGQNNPFSVRKSEGNEDRLGIWKATSTPNLAVAKEHNYYLTPNLQIQRASCGAGNDSSGSRDVQGSMQQHLENNSVEKAIPQLKSRDGSQILESYASNNAGSNEMGNSGKENSSDSFRSKFSPESFTCGFKENAQVNACDLSMLPGGKETQPPSRSDDLVRDGLSYKESANDMLHFGQTVSQNISNKNHSASAEADSQQISPQMAPSWYSQYGTFNNGLMQPVNDTGRYIPSKMGEQYSNVGNLVGGSHSVQSSKQLHTADPGYVVHMQQKSSSIQGADTLSSELLPHGATDKLLKVDKPKKRKSAMSGLLSWNKEVMQGLQRLKTLGEAEVDWARASNQLFEKVEFKTLLEDGPPMRSKRRLIYTTQLMQQLFCPPPARVVSLVANSNCEFVVYTVARAALGDACSSTCTDRSEPFSPLSNSNPLLDRAKCEKISDQYILQAAEDFITRTRKLEADFAALENRTTIPDLRVEVHDLERFAVINRFASFHQSSSSMDRTMSSLRLNPQRYVTIAPIPQNIPDRLVGILRKLKASIVKKPEIFVLDM